MNLISDTAATFGNSWKTGPHWIKDHPESTLPVACSCGSSNNVLTCNAGISGTVAPTVTAEVRFIWSGGGTSQWFVWSGGLLVGASLQSTFAAIFGTQKAYYEAASTLTWEYRIDGEDGGEFGQSKNPFYVTYNDPLAGTKLYHTVVHTGCVAANGVGGNEQAVFDAVWNKFKSLHIRKVNLVNGQVEEGELLMYYGLAPIDPNNTIKSSLAIESIGGMR